MSSRKIWIVALVLTIGLFLLGDVLIIRGADRDTLSTGWVVSGSALVVAGTISLGGLLWSLE